MITSVTTNFTRAESYTIQRKQKIADYRQEMIDSYVAEYADFWNLTVKSGTPAPPAQGVQPRAAQGQQGVPANADLSAADKIFLMGTLAADYLQFAANARSACLTLTPTAIIPTTPDGYQFLINSDGTAYLQKMVFTGGTGNWVTLQLSANGMAAAMAAGISVPSGMQPTP